jgi:hypothetical protein
VCVVNSPTECFVVPADAQAMATKRWQARYSLWEQPLSILSGGRYLERNQAQGASEGGALVQDYYVSFLANVCSLRVCPFTIRFLTCILLFASFCLSWQVWTQGERCNNLY